MARKRLTAEERKKQILIVAAREFAETGFELARMKDIAENCGVNEALIYQHFPCKEDLFIEAMSFAQTEMLGGWVAVMDAEVTGFQILKENLMARTRIVYENPHLAKVVEYAAIASSSDVRIRELNQAFFGGIQEYYSALVKKGQEDGSIRSDLDPASIAYWVRGYSHLVNLSMIIDLEDKFPMESALEHLDSLLTLIGAREKKKSARKPSRKKTKSNK